MTPILAQATGSVFEGPTVYWYGLMPLLVLAGGGLLLMVVSALVPRGWPRGGYAFVTCCLAGASIVVSFFLWHRIGHSGTVGLVGSALTLDRFSVFLWIVIAGTVFFSALFTDDYLRREGLDGAEAYALMMMCAVGGMVMSAANDLIVVFLGLETLSIALYVLAGSHLRRSDSQESAIKYFILGSFSSAFFLYGVALVYGATGSTNMAQIANFLSANVILHTGLLYAGFALLLVGLGFKVAASPFHVWTPDVYQGAPSPVTGFMASAAKAAGFAALLRVFVVTFAAYRVDWRPVVFVLAVLTLAVGSIAAIVQTNVKRMMAYSSISHAGFILVGVQAANDKGVSSALLYILLYAVMVLGSFGVIAIVGRTGDEDHGLDAYRGLARERPVLALIFTVFLLAQAGVPLTSGFVAKFGVIQAAVDAKSYALAIVAMLSAAVAAYLYLRIIVAMYMSEAVGEGEVREPVRVPVSAGLALLLAVGFTVYFGFLPGAVVDFARDAIPRLASPAGG